MKEKHNNMLLPEEEYSEISRISSSFSLIFPVGENPANLESNMLSLKKNIQKFWEYIPHMQETDQLL